MPPGMCASDALLLWDDLAARMRTSQEATTAPKGACGHGGPNDGGAQGCRVQGQEEGGASMKFIFLISSYYWTSFAWFKFCNIWKLNYYNVSFLLIENIYCVFILKNSLVRWAVGGARWDVENRILVGGNWAAPVPWLGIGMNSDAKITFLLDKKGSQNCKLLKCQCSSNILEEICNITSSQMAMTVSCQRQARVRSFRFSISWQSECFLVHTIKFLKFLFVSSYWMFAILFVWFIFWLCEINKCVIHLLVMGNCQIVWQKRSNMSLIMHQQLS